MSNAAVASTIFIIFMILTVGFGLLSVRGRQPNLSEWSVGGRNFGSVLLWVLLAGEIYTAFSYLGAAGWGYDYGAPIYYEFAYLAGGYALGYFFGPLFWGYAKKHGLVSVSDMGAHRFQSKTLGVLMALITTIFLIPYVQLEITGMGLVVNQMTYGGIDLNWAYVISFVVAESFILISGLRGSAWVSILKDSTVILTVIVIGIYVPYHFFGGYGGLFERLLHTHPQVFTLPGNSPNLDSWWFASTTIVNSLGYIVFPNVFAAYLGAQAARTIRTNSIFLPFYQILLFVPMLLGMAALLVVPHLKDSDLALLALSIKAFPAWFVGLIGVAGALSAIVPMAVFMLVIGTMWGRSILGISVESETTQKRLSQLVTFLVGVIALIFSIALPSTLVRLSVISYEGITQLAPVLILGLLWRGMTAKGAIGGFIAGIIVVVILFVTGHDPLFGINGGLYGLVVNTVVGVAVSRATATSRDLEEAGRRMVPQQP